MSSSKTSCTRCIFPAILLVVLLLQSYASGATWNDFQNRHIAPGPRPKENLNAYCNRMMSARDMAQPPCKPRNTFILDPVANIQQVCRDQSTLWSQTLRGQTFYYYNSAHNFNLIDCKIRRGTCQYQGTAYNKRICLGCSNHTGTGNPVHFEAMLP